MTLTTTVTPKELERQAAEAFIGKTWRVFLALRQDTGLGITDTIAAWEAEKLPAINGYADVTGTVGTGAYNGTTAAYELPVLTSVFAADGGSFTYDSIIVQIDGGTHPHSVGLLDAPVTLTAPQMKTYQHILVQDN